MVQAIGDGKEDTDFEFGIVLDDDVLYAHRRSGRGVDTEPGVAAFAIGG